MCLERDNVTQYSDPDIQGDVYTASFELFPFHEGASYTFFLGLLSGSGPLRGQFCVVRAIVDRFADATDWTHVLRRAYEARRIATEFNTRLGFDALTVQVPILTQMETVSDLTCLFRLFRPHDKRLKPGEFVTFEPLLKGKFQKFDLQPQTFTTDDRIFKCVRNIDEIVSPGGSDRTFVDHAASVFSTNMMQAFSHFSWHLTRRLVVTGLQGVSNGLTYTVTNPTIHSLSSKFGDSDESRLGIREFFSSHVCNNICCNWDRCVAFSPPQKQVRMYESPESISSYKYKRLQPSPPLLLYDNCLGTLL